MNRKIKFSVDEYYHVYNRGVEKRDIFLDKFDYARFLLLLKICNKDTPINVRELKEYSHEHKGESFVYVGAYCLMPNHFHILLKENSGRGISKFMSKLLTAYSMYFNKKYGHSGSLFQGVFKAQHADSDNYLKYLFSYIHLNPVKLVQQDWKENGITDFELTKNFLDNYKYSSYSDYLYDKESKNLILNKSAFPEYFETTDSIQKDLFDWLKFKIKI